MATPSSSANKRGSRDKSGASAGKSGASTRTSGLDSATRHAMIAEAAYFRAERRGFAPGYELEDWLQCEAEIEARALEQTTQTVELH